MKLSIVIPACNEERRIGKTLEEYGKFFKNLKKEKKLDSEILIVINNTDDKTEEIVKKYQRKYKTIKYLKFKQGGKGFAIIEGFKESVRNKSDLIGFVDADMSTSPLAFYDLIEKIGSYDGVIASRYLRGAIVTPKQPLARILVSRLGNFIIRSLFMMNYRDTQCGAKLFTDDAVKKVLPKLGLTQWAFDVDLLYKLKKEKRKIKEIPTNWQDDINSGLDLKRASLQVIISIIRLRIINSRFSRLQNIFTPLNSKIWGSLK